MARSSKPRKAYRPRLVGKPVTREMHRALMHPSYLALSVLTTSAEREALVSARHTLAALFNYISTAAMIDGRDVEQAQEGLRAIMQMDDRYERVKTYRATGEELAVLRAAVRWCDETLQVLRTDLIEEARQTVNAALFRGRQ